MANRLQYISSKIVSHVDAKRIIEGWKLRGDEIVFTNGCFDILHKGHVSYLAQAAAEGNKLVLALNTDASVKRQGKGEDRPINHEDARAFVLAGLGFIDLIVFFEEDTPENIIELLSPDVLAKGADYDPDETDRNSKKYIVGSEHVKANGGRVMAIPFVEGFSTTSIINKAKG